MERQRTQFKDQLQQMQQDHHHYGTLQRQVDQAESEKAQIQHSLTVAHEHLHRMQNACEELAHSKSALMDQLAEQARESKLKVFSNIVSL